MSKEPTHVVIASSDPVAENAARYAIEVTDTTPAHPMLNRLFVVLIVSFIIIGTFGAVLGTLNSVTLGRQNQILSTQNDELKAQQACTNQLLKVISTEQKARADIAADDRNAIKTLVSSIARAKSQQDVEKAFAIFNMESRTNDIRRAQYPVPNPNSKVCVSTVAPSSDSQHSPGSSKGSGGSTSSPATPTPGTSHRSVSVPRPAKTTSKPHAASPLLRPTVSSHVRTGSTHTVVASAPTKTVTKTAAPASPPAGLLQPIAKGLCATVPAPLLC